MERFVTPSDGEVSLMLGTQARSINARVNRKANLNGTPRIFGGKALSDWFQNNFDQLDTVKVVVLSPTELQLLPGSAP